MRSVVNNSQTHPYFRCSMWSSHEIATNATTGPVFQSMNLQHSRRLAMTSTGSYSSVCWTRQPIDRLRSLSQKRSLVMDCNCQCSCYTFSCRESILRGDFLSFSMNCMSRLSIGLETMEQWMGVRQTRRPRSLDARSMDDLCGVMMSMA